MTWREGADLGERVTIAVPGAVLGGYLTLPRPTPGIVVFAHGSGSSQHSPRNQHVAALLNQAGLGTLLFDLLTRDEERFRRNVFDIAMLGDRLSQVYDWVRQTRGNDVKIGFFGASTGAGAALWAAATRTDIAAVVSRGGRPDLAGSRLVDVKSPTLLIVGERDVEVLALNRQAQSQLRCESDLAIVPGATHLFEEPGALDQVAELAESWFLSHF